MIDETQKLDSTTQELVETQAIDENDVKNVKKNENVCQNGHDQLSKENRLSRYSLKLLISNNQNGSITNGHDKFLFPLNVGLTTIGRSDSNDICLIHKSISKKHACIELTLNEDTLELNKCLIWDDGSLNKTRLNNSETNLPKQEKHDLNIDNIVQFGSLKFTFLKMTESEYEEQEKTRTKLIDLYTDTNLNGSIIKKQNKTNGLFEIQNTLEETVLCENGDEEKQNGHKMYVADTDPEDNESFSEDNHLNNTSCPDFRLHMSASFVNQSVVSGKSILIPETMADEDLEETRDEEISKNEEIEEKVVEISKETVSEVEKENSTQVVTETVQVSDTVVENVEESKKEEEKVEEIPETVAVVDEKKEIVAESNVVESVQENVSNSNEKIENIVKETEENKSDQENIEKLEETNKVEENQATLEAEQQTKNLVNTEKTEEPKSEDVKKEETESKQEAKIDFEIKKYNAINDESIIINDDDEEDISLNKIDQKKEKNLIVNEKESKSDEIIVESTLLDTSDLNIKSQTASQLSEAEPSQPVEEKKEPARRGRGRRPRNSAGNQSIEESHNESKKEDDETEARPTRRSTRQSLPPAPKETKKSNKRNSSSIQNDIKNDETIIEEGKDQKTKEMEETSKEEIEEKKIDIEKVEDKVEEKFSEEKVEEEKQEEKTEEKVEEKTEAPRVTRRSSLRVRNAEAKPVIKQKRGVKLVEEDPKSEEEVTQAKVTKQEEDKPKTNRRKSVSVKKEEVEEENKEEDDSKRSLRNRRKTIEVSQVKVEEPKKKVTRRKSIKADNYNYDEEETEDKKTTKRKSDEHEKAKNKKTRKEETSDEEVELKKSRKRKTSENKKQNELDDSFTRDFKQAQSESDSTPKIFFNSKRRKTPNSSINTTPLKNNNVETPTKKFKLHKSKSSSEENLHSSDEEIEKKQEEVPPEETEKPKGRKVGRAASIRLSTAPARQSGRSQRGSSAMPHIITSVALSDKDKLSISNKGGLIIEDVKDCTHFVTNKIKKNFQFLSCLAKGAFIVSEQWLAETNKGKMFANAQTYALSDTNGEKHFKFSLKTSMSKARAHPLLSDWKFVIKFVESKEDEISLNELKTIIECAGGEVTDILDDKDLGKYCLVYKNYELYEKDEENKSKECLKMTLETLLDSILKQTFDINHDIEASD